MNVVIHPLGTSSLRDLRKELKSKKLGTLKTSDAFGFGTPAEGKVREYCAVVQAHLPAAVITVLHSPK